MMPKIRLVALKQKTNFVPLGYCLTRTKFLARVFAELELKQKTVEHEPAATSEVGSSTGVQSHILGSFNLVAMLECLGSFPYNWSRATSRPAVAERRTPSMILTLVNACAD